MTPAGEFLLSWWSFVPLPILWAGWIVHAFIAAREARSDNREIRAHAADLAARGLSNPFLDTATDADRARGDALLSRARDRGRTGRRWTLVAFVGFSYACLRMGAALATP